MTRDARADEARRFLARHAPPQMRATRQRSWRCGVVKILALDTATENCSAALLD